MYFLSKFTRLDFIYLATLFVVLLIVVMFDLSRLLVAILWAAAFCVAIVRMNIRGFGVVTVLVLFALFLLYTAINYGSKHGVGIVDVVLINSDLRSIWKPMTGFYVCTLGSLFSVLINRSYSKKLKP